ncbi:NAD-dependent epimerase/dehydratase family protein [Baia soyae]|uniref:UDP-glucose 4-epimerase n=1 Tax=Baia soyae TaxID=1544746 RepID=A0A4R2S235_9BACL|nr:NAD-dependent epimerase/dehydratase family protein [Baia soyae]TCP70588.1 UDP-glucose 4-epimerase [Baia soyae]
MKILVVGGAGFIGSHVVDLYIDNGHEVHVVDDLSTGKKGNIHPRAKFHHLDIYNDQEALTHLIQSEKFEIINHHAAQKSVPASMENPIIDAQINIMGTLNLLESAVEHGVKKFIFASSGGTLAGDISKIPTSEVDTPVLVSPYAISKYTLEKYLDFYYQHHGLNYTVLRYANVYGPRQVPDGECGVVSIFLENFMQGKPSKIYTFPHMPSGATRDYIFVKEVARVNLLVLDDGDNQVFNIGTGVETSTESVYQILQDGLKCYVPCIKEPKRKGDLERVSLNCDQAFKQLGWRYQTSLQQGLMETIYSVLERKIECK